MQNDVEKKQMVWGDNKRFNPLRDIQHFAEPPKWNSQMSNGTAKSTSFPGSFLYFEVQKGPWE